MTASGPFRPGELDGADAPDRELPVAGEAGRRVDAALAAEPPARPSDGFSDRVMAAIAREPVPSAAGFLAPLRRRSVAGVVASLEAALGLAVRGGRPIGLRIGALAYAMALLIAVGSVTGLAAAGAAGAIGIISGDRSSTPRVEATVPPSGSFEPESSDDASQDATGSLELGGSEDPAGSGSAGDGASASADDHGGSGGGDGSITAAPTEDAGGAPTASPSGTPKPSDTAQPSETPQPSSSSGG